MARIIIIGSGISGVTSAYALRQLGHEIIVLDRHLYPAMETSFANGGQLSASNAEVWNSGSTIIKGMKWMMSKDAPLLLNPLPSLHKYSWIGEFVGAIRHYRENTLSTVRLALESRKHMFRLAEIENIDFDLERRGILHIYHDAPSFEAATKVNAILTEGGLERYPVFGDTISEIEPTLSGKYFGGFFTPSDATGDIHKFTRGLALACKRIGVVFLQGATVSSVNTTDRLEVRYRHNESHNVDEVNADAVVVCAGVGSRAIAKMAGDRVNIYPVKGYSITVHLDDEESVSGAPWVSLLDESAKIVTSRLGKDRFRVAGTAEFNGYNLDIRADRIAPLLAWTRENFNINTSRVTPWAGLRPMMPDMLPRVFQGRNPRVFYNTGHGHLGWTLSAATAAQLVKLVETSTF